METSVNYKCRAFTSLEQSKKLADILPLESADMRIGNYVGKSGKVDGTNVHYYPKGEPFGAPKIINAWSLAALLDVLPEYNLQRTDWENKTEYKIVVYVNDINYVSKNYDNPLDACYELILKLNELKLL